MESRPVIRWQYLVFPHNTREVERAESLAAEIGVDTIDIFAAGGRRWTREDGFLPAVSPERPEGLLCDDPWMYLAIDWDGAVHLCCRAFQARHVCGHLGKASIREIFDNDRFQLARRVIRDGIWREPEPSVPCTGCRRLTGFVPAIAELNHKLTLE